MKFDEIHLKMTFKYNFFLLFFLFCSLSLFSQRKKDSFNKELDKLNCTKLNKVNFNDLETLYPFNSSSKIIFTSYQNHTPGIIGDELTKFLDGLHNQKIDSISLKNFKEFKILDNNEKFKLLDIIYNYGYKAKPTIYEGTKCYFPQNAILFIDSDGKLLAFIELCFGCNKFRTNNDQITVGEECSQKYNMIKQLFKDSGILYGIVENEL